MSNDIWTTNKGEEIPVSEMTDSHLLNAHKFIVGRCMALGGVEGDPSTIGVGIISVGKWEDVLMSEIARRDIEPLVYYGGDCEPSPYEPW